MSNEAVQVVKGTAFWCQHSTVNKLSGKYTMKLGRLDKNTTEAFRKAGVKVQFDSKTADDSPENMGFYVVLKSDNPVVAKDMDNNVLPDRLNVGNGSKVYAAFRLKPWTHKDSGRSGVSAKWLGLKVQELVKFDPEEANKTKADNMLDGISGEGFVFGESQSTGSSSDDTSNEEELDELFKDVG